MKGNNKDRNKKAGEEKNQKVKGNATEQMDQLQQEADKERSRKPGSQSNSSKQHNNGRGGGK